MSGPSEQRREWAPRRSTERDASPREPGAESQGTEKKTGSRDKDEEGPGWAQRTTTRWAEKSVQFIP